GDQLVLDRLLVDHLVHRVHAAVAHLERILDDERIQVAVQEEEELIRRYVEGHALDLALEVALLDELGDAGAGAVAGSVEAHQTRVAREHVRGDVERLGRVPWRGGPGSAGVSLPELSVVRTTRPPSRPWPLLSGRCAVSGRRGAGGGSGDPGPQRRVARE